jgi:methylenetetrahydrofolate dehydrogenase (NADP+) / methenyltetrahydrofolate cyclohydrolase
MSVVFDGLAYAIAREYQLKSIVTSLGVKPRMASFVFDEDSGSQLYTKLKFEAAARVGIEFDRQDFSITDPVDLVRERMWSMTRRNDLHGIMIQKPAKRVWQQYHEYENFEAWWQALVTNIPQGKDVDCLTPHNLDHIYGGSWFLQPATVRAVLLTTQIALGDRVQGALIHPRNDQPLQDTVVTVLGKSEIVGKPLAAILRHLGARVYNCGSKTLDLTTYTRPADILVSATGREHLVKGEMVKEGAIVIDVGSPQADVDYDEVSKKASFITPVPNGVGPVTVVCLLENLVRLVAKYNI